MFETVQESGMIRRIGTNVADLARDAVTPLRRRSIRWKLLRDALVLYFAFVLWLHFIGQRHRNPELHYVRLPYREAAVEAAPMGVGLAVMLYLSKVWSETRRV